MSLQPQAHSPGPGARDAAFARWWAQRPDRERQLIAAAAVLVGAALLWTLGIAPAWRTVQAYPAQRAELDSQLRTMLELQSRAKNLRDSGNNPAAADPRALQTALQASVASLGDKAQLTLNASQATVTLAAVDAGELAQWLARTRRDARLLPSQAALQRNGSTWSGTVQFLLPAPPNGG